MHLPIIAFLVGLPAAAGLGYALGLLRAREMLKDIHGELSGILEEIDNDH